MPTARALTVSRSIEGRVSAWGGVCPGGVCLPKGCTMWPIPSCIWCYLYAVPAPTETEEQCSCLYSAGHVTWQGMLGYSPPPPVDRIFDTCLWKHYLPATTVAGGNKGICKSLCWNLRKKRKNKQNFVKFDGIKQFTLLERLDEISSARTLPQIQNWSTVTLFRLLPANLYLLHYGSKSVCCQLLSMLSMYWTEVNPCGLYLMATKQKSIVFFSFEIITISLFVFYCPPTKLREGNVFTGICHSVQGGGIGVGTSHASWDR